MSPNLVISSNIEERTNYFKKVLAENSLSKTHPNLLWLGEEEKLGVEIAKKIREHLSLKPYQGNHQAVVIVTAEELTSQAQNSLLKTLEEPAGDALILLGASSEEELLPTIVSRCRVEVMGNRVEGRGYRFKNQIEKLLSENIEKRFLFIEKLEEREQFLDELVNYFRELHKQKPTKDLNLFLQDLITSKKWQKVSVNLRAILEYLMLKIPQNP